MTVIDLPTAATVILENRVIIQATEGVLGLSALATAKKSAQRILDLKGRRMNKGFIILCRSIDEIADWIAQPTQEQIDRIHQPHTRPTTFLIKKTTACPEYLCGQYNSLAIRIPRHEQMQELLARCNAPLISTSANLSGEPSSTDIVTVAKSFPNIPILKPETTMSGQPSRIVDLNSSQQIR